MNTEEAEGRNYVMINAKEDGLADEELIELYSRISMVVLMNQEKYGYEVIGHGIGNNAFDFSVVIPKNEPLPDQLSGIFFNKIGKEFKVTCKKFKLGDPGYGEAKARGEEEYNFACIPFVKLFIRGILRNLPVFNIKHHFNRDYVRGVNLINVFLLKFGITYSNQGISLFRSVRSCQAISLTLMVISGSVPKISIKLCTPILTPFEITVKVFNGMLCSFIHTVSFIPGFFTCSIRKSVPAYFFQKSSAVIS